MFTGFTFTAGVTATGIRGALGTAAEAANAANAFEPTGVLPLCVVGCVTAACRAALFDLAVALELFELFNAGGGVVNTCGAV